VGASLLITLREGLEISLVLGILATYLVKTDRRDSLRPMWLGALAALILSIAAGVLFRAAVGEFEGKWEQGIEGVIAIVAAVVLTWMIFWMRKHARGLSGALKAKLDASTSAKAVAVIAFVAVLREGFETALFLLSAETESSSGGAVVGGGLIGLAIAAVIGWAVYVGGKKIDLRQFFNITGVLLILFAAGLVGKAFHELRELFGIESGWLIEPMWTVTSGALASGSTRDFLNGLFGWHQEPERIRVITYIAYLVPVLWLYFRRDTSAGSASGPADAAKSAARESALAR
jgi:high-affinity iron transporter